MGAWVGACVGAGAVAWEEGWVGACVAGWVETGEASEEGCTAPEDCEEAGLVCPSVCASASEEGTAAGSVDGAGASAEEFPGITAASVIRIVTVRRSAR